MTQTSNTPLGGTVQRLLLVLSILGLLVSGMAFAVQPASAAAATTTARLNLREGPGTSFAVVQIIPSGSTVDITGAAQFSYLPITFSGSSGWVSATYLSTSGDNSESTNETAGGPTGTRTVIDGRLNLRAGAGTTYAVVEVMPNGAAVSLTGQTSNDFSQVTWNGTTGWAATQYLGETTTPAPSTDTGSTPTIGDTVTGTLYTTARVNLRSGPGTGYGARTVISSGETVEAMGSAQSGFTPIRSNGLKGWASSDYLTTTAPGDSTSEPSSGSGTVVGSKVTTAAVNLRSGPATSFGALRVLPPETAVSVTGADQGGFLPVTWGTLSGYVSSAFLADPGSATDPGTSATGDEAIIAIIYAAADRWGQPRVDMLRVARCESNLDPSAVNSSSGASGLFQFMPSTFAGTPNGEAGQDIFDAYTSADAAGWMWANGMRNHWECQ